MRKLGKSPRNGARVVAKVVVDGGLKDLVPLGSRGSVERPRACVVDPASERSSYGSGMTGIIYIAPNKLAVKGV